MAIVNVWLVGAGVLMLALVPCGIVAVRGEVMDRLVALELAGILAALIMLTLAEGLRRPAVYDLALALALLSLPAGLVFAHFLGRWL